MPNLHRVRVAISGGGVVGGGLTTFYVDELTGLPDPADFGAFFDSLKGLIPDQVNFNVPSTGDTIDAATGQLMGTWTNGTPQNVGGTSGADFAAGVGARIVWETGVVRGGRRVRGSTFIVPLASTNLDPDGTWNPTAVTVPIKAAADVLLGRAVPPVVWSRPRTGLGGASVGITSSRVPVQVSWLRSRRT